MELKELNKQRRKITFISLLLTILIIVVYILCIFYIPNLFVGLIGIVFVLALLYLLSKFLVYKRYLILKYEVLEYALKKSLKCKKILKNNAKNEFIIHFYAPSCTNLKSSFTIINSEDNLDVCEFEVTQKRNFKSDKVILAGKYLKKEIKNQDLDCVFILNYQDESEKYITFYQKQFQNQKSLSYKNTNKQYVCLYNQSFDQKYLDIFDKITTFHMLQISHGTLQLIYIDKLEIFDFKLQHEITSQTINKCSVCYEKLLKIILQLRRIEQHVSENIRRN